MLLSPGFFTNPFSLNVHLGFFNGLNYFSLYYLYTYLAFQRDISSHQCSGFDLDDDCCFQGFSLACWHYGCQSVQEGCLFGSPVWRSAASQTTSRVFIFIQVQLSAVT